MFKQMFKLRSEAKCPFCSKDMTTVTAADFKDKLSFKEFKISGLCQSCQDNTFKQEKE